jgi:hypothetical protein
MVTAQKNPTSRATKNSIREVRHSTCTWETPYMNLEGILNICSTARKQHPWHIKKDNTWANVHKTFPLKQPLRGTSYKSKPSSVLRGYVDSYSTLGHMECGNRHGGIPWWGFLWHMLANRALVYPSQGGRYHAEGCLALGYWLQCHKQSPWGTRQHPIVWSSIRMGLHGWCDRIFFPFSLGGLNWGLWHINEWLSHWLWRWRSLSIGNLLGDMERGSLTRDFENKMNY